MILILTKKTDPHADEVIKELARRGVGCFRLNTEDILSKYGTTLHLDAAGRWQGEIIDETGRKLALEDVRVAWLRKPDFNFTFGRASMDAFSLEFASGEIKSLIDTLYTLPQIVWINDPFIANRAKVKYSQLILAKELGMWIPKTIVTTSPQEAEKFFRECNGEVLVKSIYTNNVTIHNRNQGMQSAKVGKRDFYSFYESISMCPTQLQEYCPKSFELRVTCIGKKIFAVKIDSQRNEETRVDWRAHTRLNPHSVFNLPQKVVLFCREFMRRQGLQYGAMDFIVTPEGEYVFLENNPFGQYLWLETETGLPLTKEVAELLVRFTRKKRLPAAKPL